MKLTLILQVWNGRRNPQEPVLQNAAIHLLHIHNNKYAALVDDEENDEEKHRNDNESTGVDNNDKIIGVDSDEKTTGVK